MMIIAHRGASGYAPENTIEAFEKAIQMNCRAFEFDVHRSRDGIIVVNHDYSFKRNAGIDFKIKDLDYEEIKKINVAEFYKGEKFANPPRIEEVFFILKNKADFINVEIKNDNNIYPGIEESVVKIINDFKISDRVIISSFYFPTLKNIRKKYSDIRLAFLGHRLSTILLLPALKKAKSISCENFHFSKKIAFKFNIELLKRFGFKICIYTVNDVKEARKFEKWGIDGIFSNYPDILEIGTGDKKVDK